MEGDAEAFGELFRRHRDRMWAVALRTTGQPELAADCVQDAFISAFRRASSYRGEAAVTTWLHRIVVNACLDRLRRERPTRELPETELPDSRDEQGALEVRLDVRQALDRLPEAQRVALVLVDLHGLSVAEAAAVLEVRRGHGQVAVQPWSGGHGSAAAGTNGAAMTSYPCQVCRAVWRSPW